MSIGTSTWQVFGETKIRETANLHLTRLLPNKLAVSDKITLGRESDGSKKNTEVTPRDMLVLVNA